MNTDQFDGHTPGPWTNEYDEELGEHTIESHDGMIAQRVLGVDADHIAAAPDLLAEVKRLRKRLEDCKRQIKETADLMRNRGEGLHATDLDEFLEWME